MINNQPDNLLELTGDLVRAFLQRNNIPAEALPDLIRSTYDSLARLGKAPAVIAVLPEVVGAVSLRKSLASPDHIVSMIDGKPYRALKGHLRAHNLTPQEYRALYKLPDDYPMVAPAYSAQRSAMAKSIGLGRKPATAPSPAPSPAPSRRKLKIAGPKSVRGSA